MLVTEWCGEGFVPKFSAAQLGTWVVTGAKKRGVRGVSSAGGATFLRGMGKLCNVADRRLLVNINWG
jgi:hypothetical protein